MSSPRVAIIDIGSNSIKVLVAERRADGGVNSLFTKTIDARISAGISQSAPRLNGESMERGLAAIRDLLAQAEPFRPEGTVLVATSAVRDAQNGEEFRERVRTATGHSIRILSGDEEANLIGRGLTCDPALKSVSNFYVFDLGGGSLECLAFRNHRMEQAVSLQLGCVRLTEKLVADATATVSVAEIAAVQSLTREQVTAAPFRFNLPPDAVAVGTGGTVTTVRTIGAGQAGVTLNETPTRVAVATLRSLLASLSALPLAERRKVPGLPPARADVFPTALATLIALAELGGFSAYQHSFYNLRYGLAAKSLEAS